MSKQTQKEAVFSAVTSVLSDAGVNVGENQSASNHLTRELRSRVTHVLVEGFNNGNISLDKTFTDQASLRTYCSGLISNWLRKDTRLNGGMQYEVKNPGSRSGSNDAQLKALRALLAMKTDPDERAEIQSFIDKRLAEVNPAKNVKSSVDFSSLPAELAQKYSN